MENIISFTFNEGRGHMAIVLDLFFPTAATRLRKLLKLIDEDYEHRDELRATIVQHCGQRASALLDGRKDLHVIAWTPLPEPYREERRTDE